MNLAFCISFLYFQIQLVDYGSTPEVDSTSLKWLEKRFAIPKVLCFRGHLDGVRPLGDKWPQQCAHIMKQLVFLKCIYAKINNVNYKVSQYYFWYT